MNRRMLFGELASEFIGSMFLVLAVISPGFLFAYMFDTPTGVTVVATALSVAFMLFVLIGMFGSISGAHFNPIVTMVMLLDKKITAGKAGLFIIVQIVGGITGSAVSHLMFWDEIGSFLSIAEGVRSYAYFCEVTGSFILVLAILMLIKTKSKHLPMMVGFLVGGQLMATSSTMFANPQVTIARMLSNTIAGNRAMDALMFIAMQITGALLAYLVYSLAFKKLELGGENAE